MRERHPNIAEVNFTEFRGLANYLASNRTNIKYAYSGKNCFFDQGKIKSSPGHSPFLAALSGTNEYRNLSKYEHTTGGVTTEYLMSLYNKQWYKVDTETATRTAVGLNQTTDERVAAKQFINTLYTVSPTDGGFKFTDPDTQAAVATIPKGSMMEFGWEKMWITGVQGNEATVYGSRTATASNPTYVEDFAVGAQTELVGKGGKNTAMIFHDDTMFIFKRDSVFTIKPEIAPDNSVTLYLPKPFAVTAGAVNNDSVIVVENDVWFLTPENQIRTLGQVANYSGSSRANDISEVIRGIKDNLATDQSAVARMHYYDNIVTIALAEKGSSVANIVITYNFTTKGFGIDRFPSVSNWATVNRKVFMTTVASGQLYQDRFGYSFGEQFEIPFQVDFPFTDFEKPYMNYRARRLFVRGGRSKGVAVTVRLYKGNYETYSDYVIPAPTAAEIAESSVTAPIGGNIIGSSPIGGSGVRADDKPKMYTFNYHISTKQTSNMFAVGMIAELNGQRVEIEQITLGLLPGTSQRFNQ